MESTNSLTPYEKQVYDMAIQGKTDKEIADQLYISHHTVKSHLASIERKIKK